MDEKVKQRILSRQKALRPTIKEERPWRNASGYYDPTASLAIERITREENKAFKRKKTFKKKRKPNYKKALKGRRFPGKPNVAVN